MEDENESRCDRPGGAGGDQDRVNGEHAAAALRTTMPSEETPHALSGVIW